uniref:Uncharacterized protein n=1 Tax=Anguilla anguilla TaxID=7936 RepID=A0A0E9XXT0_ANGAN
MTKTFWINHRIKTLTAIAPRRILHWRSPDVLQRGFIKKTLRNHKPVISN